MRLSIIPEKTQPKLNIFVAGSQRRVYLGDLEVQVWRGTTQRPLPWK